MISVSQNASGSSGTKSFSTLGPWSRSPSFSASSSALAATPLNLDDLSSGAASSGLLPTDASSGGKALDSGGIIDLSAQLPDRVTNTTTQDMLSLIANSKANLFATPTGSDNTAVEALLTTPSPIPTSAESAASAIAPALTMAPIATAVQGNTASAFNVITPLPVTVTVDPLARALTDFKTNPVYAGMATALYINAAIYRSQQVSSAILAKAIDLPPAVSPASGDNMGLTDSNQSPTEERGRESAFAR